MAMDAVARSDARAISATSFFADSYDAEATATSNGFSGTREATSAWIGASVTVKDAGDARPEGRGPWAVDTARRRSQRRRRPEGARRGDRTDRIEEGTDEDRGC
jgi:predicted Zn-dependent protease